MSKTILVGILILGGILLVGVMKPGSSVEKTDIVEDMSEESTAVIPQEVITQIPIYPGSEVQSVSDSHEDQSRHVILSLRAEASISEINEWYRDALSMNGWVIKSDRNIAGYTLIQGENENLYTGVQAASGGEEGVMIISQQIRIDQ